MKAINLSSYKGCKNCMSPRRQAMMEVLLMFFIITLISLLYVVWTWPTSPMEVIGDLDRLGPAAFALDLLFLAFMYRIWKKSRPSENTPNVWE